MTEQQWSSAQKLYVQGFSALDIAEDLGVDVKELWRADGLKRLVSAKRRLS